MSDPIGRSAVSTMSTGRESRLEHSLARTLKLNYTTPELVFYRIDIDGTNSLLVIGGDGEGAYEWVVLKGGAVEKHSDCGYGMSDIALRDGLIYCFGLPPADGYFMKQIAPKTEPAVTPSETPCSRWIAMKDRRPESLRDVLVCSIYDRVSVISAQQLRWLWEDAQANSEVCAYSHWQEIPEAPSV